MTLPRLSVTPSRPSISSTQSSNCKTVSEPPRNAEAGPRDGFQACRTGKISSEEEPNAGVKETHHATIDYDTISGRKCLNQYVVCKEIGRGQYGKVRLCYDKDANQYVAIKTVNRKQRPRLGRPQSMSMETKIKREVAILKRCSHPNIVRLYEVIDSASCRKIYLVFEYLSKGEVQWQNSDGMPSMSRAMARSAARQVLSGLEYLHRKSIIHRDIKPANLLVSSDDVYKISDFGVSYMCTDNTAANEQELSKTVGTPAFFAPEMCVFGDDAVRHKARVNYKIDIWAYGVTLFCFLYGCLPFEADNEYELFRVIAGQELQFPDRGDDDDLRLANDLLRGLLHKDPNARLDFEQIWLHPWLSFSQTTTAESTTLPTRRKAKSEDVPAAPVSNFAHKLRTNLSRLALSLRGSKPGSRKHKGTESHRSGSAPPEVQQPLCNSAGLEQCDQNASTPSVISTISSPSGDSSTLAMNCEHARVNMLHDLWDASSSSEEEDTGELTLVLGRRQRLHEANTDSLPKRSNR